jgi:parvulin-like peptidyl-prolyl isomerase
MELTHNLSRRYGPRLSLLLPVLLGGFFFSNDSIGAEVVVDRVTAIVGQSPILRSEVEARLALLKKSPILLSILGLDPKEVTYDGVLDKIIEDRIIEVSAKELGAEVSDLEVNNQVAAIAKQNSLSVEGLKKSLAKEKIPYDEYRNNIRLQILKRNVFERELRRSGGITEQEIRALYENKARAEYDISVIFLGKTLSKELLASYKEGKTSLDELKKNQELVSLGWTSLDSLKKDIAVAIGNATTIPALLPETFTIQGKNALVLVLGKRKGSDEEFETMRSQLTAEAQSVDFQRRFRNWLDKKRQDMNIQINKS